jgi:hypothetical protein
MVLPIAKQLTNLGVTVAIWVMFLKSDKSNVTKASMAKGISEYKNHSYEKRYAARNPVNPLGIMADTKRICEKTQRADFHHWTRFLLQASWA